MLVNYCCLTKYSTITWLKKNKDYYTVSVGRLSGCPWLKVSHEVLVKLSARAMFSLEDLIRRRSSFKLILQPVFLTGTAGFLQNEGFKRKSAPKTEAAVFLKIESQK